MAWIRDLLKGKARPAAPPLVQPFTSFIAERAATQSCPSAAAVWANLDALKKPDAYMISLDRSLPDHGFAVISSAGREPQQLAAWSEGHGLGVQFSGLTLDAEEHRSTACAVATKPREIEPVPSGFKVAAFMTAFNEADVLEQTVAHLNAQGVDVHIIENWSGDETFEVATNLVNRGLVASLERFPAGGPTGTYDWIPLLTRSESLAAASDADWCIHHDVDEIRQSPWLGVSLRDAFWRVQCAGYNAVDFTCINFVPIDESFEETKSLASLTHFEFGRRAGHFLQIKAWQNQHESVQLPKAGGHQAVFEGRRVYPFKFLLKHYPIRSQAHGERKVLRDRLPRWSHHERKVLGWHGHYERFREDPTFLGNPADLIPYRSDQEFYRDYLIERLSRIGIKHE